MKKSQISVSFIIGVTIVLVSILFLGLNHYKNLIEQDKERSKQFSSNVEGFKNYADSCLSEEFNIAKNKYSFDQEKIKQHINSNFPNCIGSFESNEVYLSYDPDSISTSIEIYSDTILIRTALTTTIRSTDSELTINEFVYEAVLREFSQEFNKIDYTNLELDENGRLKKDTSIFSPDLYAAVHIKAGTALTDKNNLPIRRIWISMDNRPDTSFLFGNFVYDFNPELKADKKMTLEMRYEEDWLQGTPEYDLVIAYYDYAGKDWRAIPSFVEPEKNRVTAKISHFTLFALSTAYKNEPEIDGDPDNDPDNVVTGGMSQSEPDGTNLNLDLTSTNSDDFEYDLSDCPDEELERETNMPSLDSAFSISGCVKGIETFRSEILTINMPPGYDQNDNSIIIVSSDPINMQITYNQDNIEIIVSSTIESRVDYTINIVNSDGFPADYIDIPTLDTPQISFCFRDADYPYYEGPYTHRGFDIIGNVNSYAACSGVIHDIKNVGADELTSCSGEEHTQSYSKNDIQKAVVIKCNPNGLTDTYVMYFHMTEVTLLDGSGNEICIGDHIEKGTYIGTTSDHLHFEIRLGNLEIQPGGTELSLPPRSNAVSPYFVYLHGGLTQSFANYYLQYCKDTGYIVFDDFCQIFSGLCLET